MIVASISNGLEHPTMGRRTQRLFSRPGNSQGPDYALAVARQSKRQGISQEAVDVYNNLQNGGDYNQLEVSTGLSKTNVNRAIKELQNVGVEIEFMDTDTGGPVTVLG